MMRIYLGIACLVTWIEGKNKGLDNLQYLQDYNDILEEDLYIPDKYNHYRYKNQYKTLHNIEYRFEHDFPISREYASDIIGDIDELKEFLFDSESSNKKNNNKNKINFESTKFNNPNANPHKSSFNYQRGLSAEWDNIAFKRSASLTDHNGAILSIQDFHKNNQKVLKSSIQDLAELPEVAPTVNSKSKSWVDPDDPDYMWYDPYETESLFTDFTKYVTELHAKKEDEGAVFSESVYWSRKPWLVIFYAHWCGHCQAYVPEFKKFVKFLFDAKSSWSAVLNIGTVNCGAEKEASVCRSQWISAYPRIRYYRSWLSPSKAVSGNMTRGLLHEGSKSPNNLLKTTLKFLVDNSEYQSKANKGWRIYWKRRSNMPAPILQLEKSTKVADKVIRNQYKKRATRYVVILYHQVPTSSQLVVMALSDYTGITILYKKQAPGRKNNAIIFDYCQDYKKVGFRDRDQMINELINLPGIRKGVDNYDSSVKAGKYPPRSPAECERLNQGDFSEPTEIDVVDDDEDDEIDEEPEETRPVTTTAAPTDPTVTDNDAPGPGFTSTDATDISTANSKYPSSDHGEALSKIVRNDIPLQILEFPNKVTPAVIFLKKILDLSNSLNLREREIEPMKKVVAYLETVPTGSDFDVDAYDQAASGYPTPTSDWSDFCRGSKRGRRGFTCCLWRMFHTMTVHCAHESDSCSQTHDAIYAFITNFFACSNCVENFHMEYKKIPPPQRGIPNYNMHEVLWFWELHNDVNARLAGDITEDPEFPKRQVPIYEDCPQCYQRKPAPGINHTDIPWDKDQVFQYLMDYYRPFNMPKTAKKWQWPVGNYGFVKTKVGCPEGFSSWKRTQDTENYRPSNAADGDWTRYISSYTGVVGLGTAMSWEFCMKRNSDYPTNERLEFPRGDYCIVKSHGFPCPSNFTEGYVNWNDEDTNNKNSYYGSLLSKPDGTFDHDTQIKFCCRKDGNHRTRINFPQDFSYTLFPHTTKYCQAVKNKINKRAWFLFDYEDDEPFNNRVVHSEHSYPFVRNMKDGVRIYVCIYH